MSTTAEIITDLTAPAMPDEARVRAARGRLRGGARPSDNPTLLARLAEILNGPGSDRERVIGALRTFDAINA